MLSLDPSAVLWSVPESEREAALATRPLLVLLHGRGSHEGDLFSLAEVIAGNPVIASPRAPLPLGGGFSWFPPAEPGLPEPGAVVDAASAVLRWLDAVAPAARAGVLGFSQGGAVVIQLLRSAPERFAAFVTLAGFSVGEVVPTDALLETLRPPVFWGRDPHDPVIPRDAVLRTRDWLPAHSSLTEREYPGIGHSISREELDDVNDFLAATLFG